MRQVQLADIPGGDVDAEGVATSAQAVREAAARLRDAGDQAVGIWAAMPHSYDAPEAPTLHAAMHPVARDTATYAEAATAAASALTRYAEDVASVQSRMQVTAPLVQALASRIASTPVWRSDTSIANQNATLHRQVQGAQDDLETAADVCAAAIRRTLYGGYGSPAPYLSAPGPRSHSLLPRHLGTLDDPRFNPFFFLNKTPADVNAWWRGLSPEAQHQLITDRPNLIGNRDGIPAAARDEANRIRLVAARAQIGREIRDLERRLAGEWEFSPHNPSYRGPQNPQGPLLWDEAGQILLRRAHARLEAVKAVERTVARTTVAPRQLLTLRADRDLPRAAVAIGDVDRARHVGVLVGGTGTTVTGGLEKTDTDAESLLRVSHRLVSASTGPTTIISWLDYDAPPALTNAISSRRAVTAGRELATFTDGLWNRSTPKPRPRISIFGHSYGALVANEAGFRAPQAIENIVVGGAPGVGQHDAAGVQRYSLLANKDPIRAFHAIGGETSLGLIPYDFASEGNHGPWAVLSTEPTTSTLDEVTSGSSGHSEYLADGSTSQANIAAIIVGRPDKLAR